MLRRQESGFPGEPKREYLAEKRIQNALHSQPRMQFDRRPMLLTRRSAGLGIEVGKQTMHPMNRNSTSGVFPGRIQMVPSRATDQDLRTRCSRSDAELLDEKRTYLASLP